MRNSFTWKRWLLAAALLFGILPYAMAQQVVKGVVRDANGVPLVGVNVVVTQAPTVGATTDIEGSVLHTGLSGGIADLEHQFHRL